MSEAYLDYAATSAIRPDTVVEAVAAYLRDIGATPGRAAHRRALQAGRIALRCRRVLARLTGIPGDPGRIVLQLNATHALNTALFGLLRPGDHVVRTVFDHNAVRRPLAALQRRGVRQSVLAGSAAGEVDLDEAERVLAGRVSGGRASAARLLVLPHASNVLGVVVPVRELVERAHACGALVLLDAAQSAGHVPLDIAALGADLVAFTGHKGLLGPQGIGALWVRPGVDLEPLLYGGSGADSATESMPDSYPDHLEAGTQNGPGMAGLLAGIEWLLETGVHTLHSRTSELKRLLREQLTGIPAVTLHSPPAPDGVGIVTLSVAGMDPAEVARRLDTEHGVLCRAGLHCAPETHALLGTLRTGAVRLSLGWASTRADVDRAVHALRVLAGNASADAAVHASVFQ